VGASMPPDSTDFSSFGILALGVGLLGIGLAVHAFFMFVVLRTHSAFVSTFHWMRGPRLLIASILLATTVIAVACFIQIAMWGFVIWRTGGFARYQDAMYFSSTTYTTLGTSQHVLLPPYRVLEPLEATNGLLANGLNAAVLFSLMSSLGRHRSDYEQFFR